MQVDLKSPGGTILKCGRYGPDLIPCELLDILEIVPGTDVKQVKQLNLSHIGYDKVGEVVDLINRSNEIYQTINL